MNEIVKCYYLPIKSFSGNHRLGVNGKKRFRNLKYQTFIKEIRDLFPIDIPLREGKIGMELMFSHDDKRKRDLDNMAKSILDALKGVLYKDDSQIFDLHLKKVNYNNQNAILIKIWDFVEPTDHLDVPIHISQ